MERAQMEQATAISEKLKIAGEKKKQVEGIVAEPDFGILLTSKKGNVELSNDAHAPLIDKIKKNVVEYFECEVKNLQNKFAAI